MSKKKHLNAKSGRYVDKNGNIGNFVDDLLAAGSTAEPIGKSSVNVTQFLPSKLLYAAENGDLYDLKDLIDNIGTGTSEARVREIAAEGDAAIVGTAPEKYNTLGKIADGLESSRTVSGSVVTLDGAAPINAEGAVIEIDLVQEGEGEPSPTNVRPVVGQSEAYVTVTGRNCINFTAVTQTLNGVTMTVNAATGEVSLNGTAAANTIFEIGTIDLLKPGVNYILTGCPSGGGANTYRLAVPEPYWTYDDGAGRGFVHYKPVNTRSVRLIVQQGVSVENLVFKPMIRLAAETDSTFEKAANSVYKTVFGEIVYSGRFDLVKGELTSDMAYEQMTYSYLSGLSSDYIDYVYTEANGNEIWVRNWNYDKAAPRRIGGIKAAGNMFRITSMHDTNRSASQNRIYFKVGEIDNVADFLQAVQAAEQNGGGLFVAYELAEPTTYRLTPQQIKLFKGVNNVWCDTGSITVKYQPDNLIGEIKGLIQAQQADAREQM